MNILKRSILILFLFTFVLPSNYSQDLESNYKSTVHTFNEAWNTGKLDLLDKVVHPDYLKLEGDLKVSGIEALKQYVKDYRESYIDVKITYIDEVYGRDKAAIKFTIEGTPKISEKKFKAEGIVIFQFRDGKIIEDKSVFDQLSALKQQGYEIVDPKLLLMR